MKPRQITTKKTDRYFKWIAAGAKHHKVTTFIKKQTSKKRRQTKYSLSKKSDLKFLVKNYLTY